MRVTAALLGEEASPLVERRYGALLVANATAATGTVLVSPVLAAMAAAFGIASGRAGLVITAFTLPSAACIPVVGMIADRYGRKPVLVTSLLLYGGAGLAVGLAPTFEAVLAFRALQGVGYAGVTPVVITAIGDAYEGAVETTAQGLRFSSSAIAQAVVPLLAGVLVAVAWRYPFAIYGVGVVAAAVVAVAFDPAETPRGTEPGEAVGGGRHRDGNAGEHSHNEVGGGNSHDGDAGRDPRDRRDRRGYVRRVGALAARPRVAATLLAFAVVAFLFMGFQAYNSFLVVEALGGTAGQAGALVTVLSVANAAAASQTGRVAAAAGGWIRPLAGALVLLGAATAAFGAAPSFLLAAAAVAAVGTATGVAFSLLRSAITGFAPSGLRGGLVGLGESVIRLANSAAPPAMGAAVALLQVEGGVGLAPAVRLTVAGAGVAGGLVGLAAVVAVAAAGAVAPGDDSV